tara:strand:+ start:1029 stop:1439 length:411 start_codon:yes stop_codon:yes gene_type:complete
MKFQDSLSVCLLKKYASFNGRASRPEFWYFYLAAFVYMMVGGFFLGLIGVSDAAGDIAIIVLLIPILIPSIAVTARRLHDVNQSGWMQLIFYPGFIADEFLGTGWVIYILTLVLWAFWFSQAGQKGKNRFGPQTRK